MSWWPSELPLCRRSRAQVLAPNIASTTGTPTWVAIAHLCMAAGITRPMGMVTDTAMATAEVTISHLLINTILNHSPQDIHINRPCHSIRIRCQQRTTIPIILYTIITTTTISTRQISTCAAAGVTSHHPSSVILVRIPHGDFAKLYTGCR